MGRILTIAQTEFLALVRSKFFFIGVLSMPALMAVLFGFMRYADRAVDREERRFGVLDRTHVLYPAIVEAVDEYNREAIEDGQRTGPHFEAEPIAIGSASIDDVIVAQSERVRAKKIFAFVDIPESALDPASKAPIRYYSQQTSYQGLSSFLRPALNGAIERQRLKRAGVDPAVVSSLTAKAEVTTFGLVERKPDGSLTPAKEVDELQRFGVPFFFLMLMFVTVMSNAQHLINTIIEEKMSKINEVLLGSVSAFQILMGKLLGVVAVTLVLAFVYLGGGAYAMLSLGRTDVIDPVLLGWFLVFLLCASLMFGSVFQALSSACADLKDAQSMLQPAMMTLIVSYLSSFLVIRAPESPLAIGLSFVPMVSPFAMMLRIAMPPGPPIWQVLISVALLVVATIAAVWAAARIFRVGLLMQGKTPNLPELWRWIRA